MRRQLVAFHVDSEVGHSWEREDIPKEDALYLRVHKIRRQHGVIGPSAFEAKGAPGEREWIYRLIGASTQIPKIRGIEPGCQRIILLSL